MKRVLIDCDGVVADFHKPTLDFFERLTGIRHDVETFPQWDIIDFLGHEYQEALHACWSSEGWCASLPVYDGAVEGIQRLREVAEVFFVTAQMTHSRHWMWERVQWLKQHFDADDRHVVLTLSKHLVLGDVFVDDKVQNVAAWTNAHPDKCGVLWHQPTNARDLTPAGAVRCGSWAELARLAQCRLGVGSV